MIFLISYKMISEMLQSVAHVMFYTQYVAAHLSRAEGEPSINLGVAYNKTVTGEIINYTCGDSVSHLYHETSVRWGASRHHGGPIKCPLKPIGHHQNMLQRGLSDALS